MFQLKIALLIIMLAGAGGGYLYVNKLQKDNAILKTNQIKLETAVEESNQGGGDNIDFVSNGFKCRDGAGQLKPFDTKSMLSPPP